jgi:hypothetical protein
VLSMFLGLAHREAGGYRIARSSRAMTVLEVTVIESVRGRCASHTAASRGHGVSASA